MGLGALVYLIVSARLRPGREEVTPPRKYVERDERQQVLEQVAAPKPAAKVTEVVPDSADTTEAPPEGDTR